MRAVEMMFHPVADLFPMLPAEEFNTLVASIRENGLRSSIVLYDGQILDGRNRYRACLVANVEPHFEEWDGEGDMVAYALDANLHRRHLTPPQCARGSGAKRIRCARADHCPRECYRQFDG